MVNANDSFKDAIFSVESGIKHLQNHIGQIWSDSIKSNIKRDARLRSFPGLHELKLKSSYNVRKESKTEARDDITTSFKPFLKASLDSKERNCSICSYGDQRKQSISCETKQECLHLYKVTCQLENLKTEERTKFSLDCFMGFVCDQLKQNLQKFELGMQDFCNKGKRIKVNGSLRNSMFARVASAKEVCNDIEGSGRESRDASHEVTNELIGQSVKNPDNKMILLVHDFFKHTESEGRKFFEELDRDGDGQVDLKDLEVAMRKRKLPLPATTSLLKSAFAGGISCAFSCALMHPVDTIKTQVQASMLPQIGFSGLYKGSIPAIVGQFSSHGLRTGIFEASKIVLGNVSSLTELQVQSVASFCGTFLGTAMRIPCEVLKQRLQVGQFKNVGEGIVGIWSQEGLNGFFRGTGATLVRELPFYVAGMGLYAQSKKVTQNILGRELEPWETMAVGAISGGLTAIMTTPIDVMKTRMMTAASGETLSASMVFFSILQQDGILGFYKGAIPRFFWVAPLGALNFAGYEIVNTAMQSI